MKFNKNDFYDFDENDKFHLQMAKDFEDDDNAIDPECCEGSMPSDYPIYSIIKYPSGKYNFFHFNIFFIIRHIADLPTIKEQVKYLEECKAKFDYKIDFSDLWSFIIWQDVIGKSDKSSESSLKETYKEEFEKYENLSLPKSGIKYSGDDCLDIAALHIEIFLVEIEKLTTYKKNLLSIEEKYGIPEKRLSELVGQAIEAEKTIKPIDQIHWTGKHSQLVYLVKRLQDEGFLSKAQDIVPMIEKHFCNDKKEAFKNSSQVYQNVIKVNKAGVRKKGSLEEVIAAAKRHK
jgi:hypothetical protein